MLIIVILITGISIAAAFFYQFQQKRAIQKRNQLERNREKYEHMLKVLRQIEENRKDQTDNNSSDKS